MADQENIIQIWADGNKVGTFNYKDRKKHKHLFKLAGIELINGAGEKINKSSIYDASLEEVPS